MRFGDKTVGPWNVEIINEQNDSNASTLAFMRKQL